MSYSRKNLSLMIFILCIILLNIVIGLYLIINYEEKKNSNDLVVEITDGDTFVIENKTIIRLLCVNTPEKGEEGYSEAKEFLQSLIFYKEVKLIEPKTLNKTDKYGRELRFVYVEINKKEVFVNKEILEFGFGKYYPYEDKKKECEMVRN